GAADERQAERLQLRDVSVEVGHHDADVVDPPQPHSSTRPPVSIARSHASATASVRIASAGGQKIRDRLPLRATSRKRSIERSIGSPCSVATASPRDVPVSRYASGPRCIASVASSANTSVAYSS